MPPEEIVPALTLQITAVSALLLTAAVNCNFAPDEIVALSGETVGIEFAVLGGCAAELGACAPKMEEQFDVASTSTRRQNKPAFWRV